MRRRRDLGSQLAVQPAVCRDGDLRSARCGREAAVQLAAQLAARPSIRSCDRPISSGKGFLWETCPPTFDCEAE
jgi:hypothetical protein